MRPNDDKKKLICPKCGSEMEIHYFLAGEDGRQHYRFAYWHCDCGHEEAVRNDEEDLQ